MPRYRFHLDASRLGASDSRFVWDADFGGDLDFVDYGKGRISALANYEVILGNQFRSFDPNQGSYTLDLSASYRLGANEVAFVFHHVSRHLSDWPKPFPVDWNMAGVRFMRRAARGRLAVTAEGRALGTLKRSYVDYTAEVGGWLDLSVALNAHVLAVAHGDAYGLLVERPPPGRRRTAAWSRWACACAASAARWTSSWGTSGAWTPRRWTSRRATGSSAASASCRIRSGGLRPREPPYALTRGAPTIPRSRLRQGYGVARRSGR